MPFFNPMNKLATLIAQHPARTKVILATATTAAVALVTELMLTQDSVNVESEQSILNRLSAQMSTNGTALNQALQALTGIIGEVAANATLLAIGTAVAQEVPRAIQNTTQSFINKLTIIAGAGVATMLGNMYAWIGIDRLAQNPERQALAPKHNTP